MELSSLKYHELTVFLGSLWDKRDRRMDEYPLMNSPLPTFFICCGYLLFVTLIGPSFMKYRKPLNLKAFRIFYDLFQVVFSLYLFTQVYTYTYNNFLLVKENIITSCKFVPT